MKKTLVVLAAGIGSRYGGIKQLDKVGPSGETIIDYSLFDAIDAGFNKVIFIIRKEIEKTFKEELGNKYEKHIKTEYVYQKIDDLLPGFLPPPERKKPWGTGHALLTCLPKVKEPFLIINADDFYGNDSFKKASIHLESFGLETVQSAMVGFMIRNTLSIHGTVSRGLCRVDNEDNLTSIKEIHGIHHKDGIIRSDSEHAIKSNEVASMNMWLFNPKVFKFAESYFKRFLKEKINLDGLEFYIPEIINNLILEEKTKVKVLRTTSEWFGVTYREDKPTVKEKIKQLVEKGLYPEQLWKHK
ncbi:MAG: sugar phosphate nucleotidyltransferase [Acidobacteriota bacterium]